MSRAIESLEPGHTSLLQCRKTRCCCWLRLYGARNSHPILVLQLSLPVDGPPARWAGLPGSSDPLDDSVVSTARPSPLVQVARRA